jgi:hypothetical protein
MITNVRLTKVQVIAEFVLDDGGHLEPGAFQRVFTAREWAGASRNLETLISATVAEETQTDPQSL